MNINKDLKKYEKWYETEPFEDFVGPFFYKKIKNHYISAFECKDHHLNSMGSLHGGMIMSFIDYTMFVVCLETIKEQSFVTVSCSTEFLNPSVSDEVIFGDGEITQETKSMIFVKGKIFNDQKKIISTFSGILKKIKSK
tara:strand:- start:685 stop:1101 length:417 start_codon:yes stop_codon:yes gene_type:complete